MADWLAGVIGHYPGVANVPEITILLLYSFIFIVGNLRQKPTLWPGRAGQILKACFHIGSGVIIFFCFWGCYDRATQTTFARLATVFNPLCVTILGIAWLLVVVPCLLRDVDRKQQKRKAKTDPPGLSS